MDRILRCTQGVEDVCFVVQDHWLPWLSAGSRRIDHFGLGMSYCLMVHHTVPVVVVRAVMKGAEYEGKAVR